MMVENILSVDVEEVFHAEYLRHLNRENLAFRSPVNIRDVLKILSGHEVTAAFFVVGEIAENFPEVIQMIEDGGHEVAFHGWSHLPLWELSANSFREELTKFKRVYPCCIGYRAPSFSLNNDTKWSLRILHECGFRYDSSIFPARTHLYGVPDAPLKPYKPSLDDVSKEAEDGSEIYEFPVAVYSIFGVRIPIAGGFWIRFWNTGLIIRGIKKLNRKGLPAVLYIHNWELDPETPRLNLNLYRSFVTYHRIRKASSLLDHILREFRFGSFSNYMDKVCIS